MNSAASPVPAAPLSTPSPHGGATHTSNPYAVSTTIAKKLPVSHIKKSVERLSATTRSPSPELDQPVVPPLLRPKKEIEKSVDRLYTESVVGKQQRKEALEKRVLVDRRPHIVMPEDEVANSVMRLSNAEIKNQQERLERLKQIQRQRVQPKVVRTSNDKIEDTISRMYAQQFERSRVKREQLIKQYVDDALPKPKKRSSGEINETVDRLYVKK